MKMRTLLLAGLGCVLLWVVTAAAAAGPKVHALKVGKKGEITLTQMTKVGDKVLQPDTYVVQHRVSKNGDHFVRFVELKQVQGANPGSDAGPVTYTEEDKAGEIKCQVQPAAGSIKETTVYMVSEGGTQRITKVSIKGEDFVHVIL